MNICVCYGLNGLCSPDSMHCYVGAAPGALGFGFIHSKLWLGAPWGVGARSRMLSRMQVAPNP